MRRAQFSAPERRFRSRLAKLVHEQPFIRATLNVRQVTCGKKGCRCAKGDKHQALYLVCSVKGKPRQMFVPPALEQEVRQWVENYRSLKDLVETLSEMAWESLRTRKAKDDS